MKFFSFFIDSFLFLYRLAKKAIRTLVLFLGLLVALLIALSPLIFIHKQLILTAPKLMGYDVKTATVYALSACTTSQGSKPKFYKQTVFVSINETKHSVNGQPCDLALEGQTLQAVTNEKDGRLFIQGFKESAWSFENIVMLSVSIVAMPVIGILLGLFMLTIYDRRRLKKPKTDEDEEDSENSL